MHCIGTQSCAIERQDGTRPVCPNMGHLREFPSPVGDLKHLVLIQKLFSETYKEKNA